MTKTATVYLTRNGLLEPLGQSQVFTYLRGLSRNYLISLISFEKCADWSETARVEHAREECEQLGIRWRPQRFRQTPRIWAPVFSIIKMARLTLREVKNHDVQLIHARSYVPAAAALLVHKLTGVPFIFDMRALWPEELIDAGQLKRDSAMHRVIVWLERVCLRDAAAVVSLTYSATVYLQQKYPTELAGKEIKVISTCTDLSRFSPAPSRHAGPQVIGCVGTLLSGWFRTDWLAAWFECVAEDDPRARFEIVTRDDESAVRLALDPRERLMGRLRIGPKAPEEMPDAIRGHDVSVMFFSNSLSKLGSAPTRMGEVLASGLPIVANTGVGDIAEIVLQNRVGVLVEGPSPAQMRSALRSLRELLQDPELKNRCRRTAEAQFSLTSGTEAYRSMYASVEVGSGRRTSY